MLVIIYIDTYIFICVYILFLSRKCFCKIAHIYFFIYPNYWGLYQHGLTLILAWISNYNHDNIEVNWFIHYKLQRCNRLWAATGTYTPRCKPILYSPLKRAPIGEFDVFLVISLTKMLKKTCVSSGLRRHEAYVMLLCVRLYDNRALSMQPII